MNSQFTGSYPIIPGPVGNLAQVQPAPISQQFITGPTQLQSATNHQTYTNGPAQTLTPVQSAQNNRTYMTGSAQNSHFMVPNTMYNLNKDVTNVCSYGYFRHQTQVQTNHLVQNTPMMTQLQMGASSNMNVCQPVPEVGLQNGLVMRSNQYPVTQQRTVYAPTVGQHVQSYGHNQAQRRPAAMANPVSSQNNVLYNSNSSSVLPTRTSNIHCGTISTTAMSSSFSNQNNLQSNLNKTAVTYNSTVNSQSTLPSTTAMSSSFSNQNNLQSNLNKTAVTYNSTTLNSQSTLFASKLAPYISHPQSRPIVPTNNECTTVVSNIHSVRSREGENSMKSKNQMPQYSQNILTGSEPIVIEPIEGYDDSDDDCPNSTMHPQSQAIVTVEGSHPRKTHTPALCTTTATKNLSSPNGTNQNEKSVVSMNDTVLTSKVPVTSRRKKETYIDLTEQINVSPPKVQTMHDHVVCKLQKTSIKDISSTTVDTLTEEYRLEQQKNTSQVDRSVCNSQSVSCIVTAGNKPTAGSNNANVGCSQNNTIPEHIQATNKEISSNLPLQRSPALIQHQFNSEKNRTDTNLKIIQNKKIDDTVSPSSSQIKRTLTHPGKENVASNTPSDIVTKPSANFLPLTEDDNLTVMDDQQNKEVGTSAAVATISNLPVNNRPQKEKFTVVTNNDLTDANHSQETSVVTSDSCHRKESSNNDNVEAETKQNHPKAPSRYKHSEGGSWATQKSPVAIATNTSVVVMQNSDPVVTQNKRKSGTVLASRKSPVKIQPAGVPGRFKVLDITSRPHTCDRNTKNLTNISVNHERSLYEVDTKRSDSVSGTCNNDITTELLKYRPIIPTSDSSKESIKACEELFAYRIPPEATKTGTQTTNDLGNDDAIGSKAIKKSDMDHSKSGPQKSTENTTKVMHKGQTKQTTSDPPKNDLTKVSEQIIGSHGDSIKGQTQQSSKYILHDIEINLDSIDNILCGSMSINVKDFERKALAAVLKVNTGTGKLNRNQRYLNRSVRKDRKRKREKSKHHEHKRRKHEKRETRATVPMLKGANDMPFYTQQTIQETLKTRNELRSLVGDSESEDDCTKDYNYKQMARAKFSQLMDKLSKPELNKKQPQFTTDSSHGHSNSACSQKSNNHMIRSPVLKNIRPKPRCKSLTCEKTVDNNILIRSPVRKNIQPNVNESLNCKTTVNGNIITSSTCVNNVVTLATTPICVQPQNVTYIFNQPMTNAVIQPRVQQPVIAQTPRPLIGQPPIFTQQVQQPVQLINAAQSVPIQSVQVVQPLQYVSVSGVQKVQNANYQPSNVSL